jgi:transcriptional regulator with XRE-family HTH domain
VVSSVRFVIKNAYSDNIKYVSAFVNNNFQFVAFCLQGYYTSGGGDYMELADRVRCRREELRLTQEELAQRMGYKSRVSINKIENGRPVSQKIIARLADALDVSIPYLMGWDEKPADDLEAMGSLAAQVLLDPAAMDVAQKFMAMDESDRQAVRDFMALGESDRFALRLVMSSMSEKQKKTDAGASVVETEKCAEKADCNM